jgi:hypothetical protein
MFCFVYFTKDAVEGGTRVLLVFGFGGTNG